MTGVCIQGAEEGEAKGWETWDIWSKVCPRAVECPIFHVPPCSDDTQLVFMRRSQSKFGVSSKTWYVVLWDCPLGARPDLISA